MSRIIKNLLISILISVLLITAVATPVAAQQTNPWYSQDFGSWYAKVYQTDNSQEIFGERYTAAQVQWVFYGLMSLFINKATAGNLDLGKCIVSTQATGDVGPCFGAISEFIKKIASVQQQSNLGKTEDKNQSIIAAIFADRPLSGITYVKDIGRKFHLIPEAKAQAAGFGYQRALGSLPEVQQMWNAVRNLSYAIFVFIILIFAFMIMFRVKISPQVVISVQSALPKLAITLVLVTFSYAIAGFMIDIMYVVIGIISLIFSQIKVAGVALGGLSGIGTNSVTGYFDMLTRGPAFLGGGSGILGFMLMYWVNFILAFIIIAVVGLFQGLCGGGGAIGGSLMSGLTFIIGFIAMIILLIILIINFFKVVWLLAKTFLFVILFTVFAPIQLTLGAVVPALGFGSWVKSYASKLAVFPAVGTMFLLALLFMQMAWESVQQMKCSWGALSDIFGTSSNGINFPAGWPPLFGGSAQTVALLFLIASMGIFVMIPKVGDMVESFIAGKPFAFGTAIGETPREIAMGTGLALKYGGAVTRVGREARNIFGFGGGAGGAPQTGAEIDTRLGAVTRTSPPSSEEL